MAIIGFDLAMPLFHWTALAQARHAVPRGSTWTPYIVKVAHLG